MNSLFHFSNTLLWLKNLWNTCWKPSLCHEPCSGTWSLRWVSVQYFHCWNTSDSLSRPPWWKWKILYWLSLLATTSCPQVHASSLWGETTGRATCIYCPGQQGAWWEGEHQMRGSGKQITRKCSPKLSLKTGHRGNFKLRDLMILMGPFQHEIFHV